VIKAHSNGKNFYGFRGSGINQNSLRGSLLVIKAHPDGKDNVETTNEDSNTESIKIKKKFNPIYAFFVLGIVLLARIAV